MPPGVLQEVSWSSPAFSFSHASVSQLHGSDFYLARIMQQARQSNVACAYSIEQATRLATQPDKLNDAGHVSGGNTPGKRIR